MSLLTLLYPPLAALLLGYVLGSIPFGLLFTRAAGMGDVRSIGSGNIGATNVLRTGNKLVAFLTLLADMLKATVPMVLWFLFADAVTGTYWAGFGAFLGHLFPVWLGFKGGKGIATFVGVLLGVGIVAGNWWGLLAFAVGWLGIAFTMRLSSLAALVATAIVPLVYYLTSLEAATILTGLMAVVSWVMHRANISRLFDGTEPKIGDK